MTRSARLLIADDREPPGDDHEFWTAMPPLVDGGARVVAAYRYCPANEDGPASATVLVHWGEDDELPEWGTHVLSHEADLRRYLLWEARYFASFPEAWADLRGRMPAWRPIPRPVGRGAPGRAGQRSRPVRG